MASRPSTVAMPFLLIVVASSMAMLVSSKIIEPEMTKMSSIAQLPPNQLSGEKMFDISGLQQCWASFSRIGECSNEINLVLQVLKYGGRGKVFTGLMGPVCCDVVKVMHEHCWPQMLPDPLFIKINFFCAPTPVGPPLPAPQVPAPAPAPQDPSPAPAPQDPTPPQYSYPTPPVPQNPPQNPTPPQYSYPTPPAPQDPPPPQYSYPTPPAPQDPLPSPATPQYPSPTTPEPPCSCCHDA